MRFHGMTQQAGRIAGALAIVAGLVLGLGVSPAAADEEIGAPTLISVRLDAPDAYVTFKDNSGVETHFFILLKERDNPDRFLYSWSYPAVPGEWRVTTRSLRGVTPGVAYCGTVTAYRSRDLGEVLLDPFADARSRDSNTVCTDPTKPSPDLALEKVGGREEREWAIVWNQAPAYLVNFRNDGADANSTVVVDIDTSGRAALADQPAVIRQGWEALGFTCVAKQAVSGSTTGGLRCTGGTLKRGERANPAIAVRFTGPGYGYIHVSIGVSGGPAEVDTNDNRTVLGIRIS